MTVAAAQPRPDRVALGILLILLSTLFTSLQDAIFKYASTDVTMWQLYVLRSLFLIPALLAVAFIWGDGAASWRQALRPWPMARALLFLLMYFSMYSSITVLPLATIAAGLYTAPLFIAALSALLISEPVGRRGWFAIALGFAGVLLILRPGTDAFSWLTILPVLGGFFYSLSALVTRGKCRALPPVALALSLSLILLFTGILFSAAQYLWQPSPVEIAVSPFLFGPWGALGPAQWTFVAMLAALMVANGLVLPAAYQSAPAAVIATFDYCYLIFATLLGFVVFAEFPDFQTIIGMVMIAGAGLMVARK